jgi:hypothetical protein
MMTPKELIKSLEAQGWEPFEDGSGNITVHKGMSDLTFCNKVTPDYHGGDVTIAEWFAFYSVLMDYALTPMDERKDKPKYRVRLRGFNSENGHQYLTADRENVNSAKFFACAERQNLKQEFTQEELNVIANRDQFKGVSWFQDLIRHADPVEERND